jgi:hypothetical protein
MSNPRRGFSPSALSRCASLRLRNLKSNLAETFTMEFRSGRSNTTEVKLMPTDKARAAQAERLGLKVLPGPSWLKR